MTPASLLSLLRDLRAATVQLLGEIEAYDFHHPLEPSGWTVLELVTHLTRDDEHYWFVTLVGGEPRAPWTVATHSMWPTGHPGPVPVTKADACCEYLHAVAVSEAVLADRGLDEPTNWLDPTVPSRHQPRTIADVLALAVLEYSMHVGHLEAAAELFSQAGQSAEPSGARSSGRGEH
ncbi:MAG: DUF664 domain-containing protein [Knoellia sp.]